MKQNTLSLAQTPRAPSPVTVLQFKGQLRLNPDPLAGIYAAQGEDAAEDTVCRALARMANRVGDLQDMHKSCAFAQMPTPATRIATAAKDIGLTEVAIAAENVASAATQANGIALEATMSRLERCFDLAMTEVWSFQSPY